MVDKCYRRKERKLQKYGMKGPGERVKEASFKKYFIDSGISELTDCLVLALNVSLTPKVNLLELFHVASILNSKPAFPLILLMQILLCVVQPEIHFCFFLPSSIAQSS